MLSFMNLTNFEKAFEQIAISSFKEDTLVSITIPQINYNKIISLNISNSWTYSDNFMQDISVPLNVSQFLQGVIMSDMHIHRLLYCTHVVPRFTQYAVLQEHLYFLRNMTQTFFSLAC